ncbi:MAG: hypothetical protein ABIY70_14390 [Capsulimonas sp.]|uniref:hypothetical protein n=1 Tax=Capsulimonas sp. TaxID=2494211 RepID=UPI003267F9AE
MAKSDEELTLRQRSPNFPYFGLDVVAAAAPKLYQKDRRAAIPREIAAKHLGYETLNGAGGRLLAALNQFGFVEDAGDRKVRVSLLGERLTHPKNDAERNEILREAVRRPKLFNAIITKYGIDGLPSAPTLKSELIREYGFNPTAADEFQRSLRRTIHALPVDSDVEADGDLELELETEPIPTTLPAKEPLHVGFNVKPQLPSNAQADFVLHAPLSARTSVALTVQGIIGKEEAERLSQWWRLIVEPTVNFWMEADMKKSEETSTQA